MTTEIEIEKIKDIANKHRNHLTVVPLYNDPNTKVMIMDSIYINFDLNVNFPNNPDALDLLTKYMNADYYAFPDEYRICRACGNAFKITDIDTLPHCPRCQN